MLLLLLSGCADPRLISQVASPPVQVQHSQQDGKIGSMLSAAKAQYKQHQLKAAGQSLEAVLDLAPANQKALYYLGLVARQTWVEAHLGQRRAARQPEQLPVPNPQRRSL